MRFNPLTTPIKTGIIKSQSEICVKNTIINKKENFQ